MKYQYFHATLADLTPGLQQIESRFKLKYTRKGWQKSEHGETYKSVFDIPDLGVRINRVPLLDGFLVCPHDIDCRIRTVSQSAGGPKYMVDIRDNPAAFGFFPGGIHGKDLLVGTYIWPAE